MIDRRTAFASALFFSVALVNPRDFPIENVPLIYPAFLVFWMQMGSRTMLQGLRRVRYLLLLLVGYQLYVNILRLTLGASLDLIDLAYVIEPAMILAGAGATTVRSGGTKAAVWAFVSIIAVSAVWGVGIYTVGEPFASLRATIQHSVGGNVVAGAMIRDADIQGELTVLSSLNAGLTTDIVTFAYQLSAAIVLVVTAMLAKSRSVGVSYGIMAISLVVLLAGVITNTERATVLAASAGIGAFVFTGSRKDVSTARTRTFLVLGIVFVLGLVSASQLQNDTESLLTRNVMEADSNLKTVIRLYMSVPAVMSIFYQPFGAGDLSAHYIESAFSVGWLTLKNGRVEAHSPHNHFAAIIMIGGVVGLASTLLLFRGLWKRLASLRRGRGGVYARMLAAACVASLVHSLFHNAGFFALVPPTLIVFGMLWGETLSGVKLPVTQVSV